MDQDRKTETRPQNDLPEARDSTTENIHNLSNFNVSDALGVPLLTKDVGAAQPRSGSQEEGRRVAGETETRKGGSFAGGVFDVFGHRDRLAFGVATAMMLLPLIGGSTGFMR